MNTSHNGIKSQQETYFTKKRKSASGGPQNIDAMDSNLTYKALTEAAPHLVHSQQIISNASATKQAGMVSNKVKPTPKTKRELQTTKSKSTATHNKSITNYISSLVVDPFLSMVNRPPSNVPYDQPIMNVQTQS